MILSYVVQLANRSNTKHQENTASWLVGRTLLPPITDPPVYYFSAPSFL